MQRRLQLSSLAATIACLAALAWFPGTSQAQTDLLTNGGFESGALSPWQGASTASLSAAAAHGGSLGVRLPSAQLLTQRWITVVPGRTYVLSAWFRWTAFAGSNWGYDTIYVGDTNWQTVAGAYHLHANYARDQWHKIALTFIPTTTAVEINIGVYGPQNTVDLAFDDVRLFEKTGNLSPVAAPSASVTAGSAPLPVQFAAHAEDPDGAIAAFQWDFGDGSLSIDENPTHTFTSRGRFTVTLTVGDNEGARTSQSLTVTVLTDTNPVVTISAPSALERYATGASQIVLAGSAAAGSGRSIQSVVWDNVNADAAGLIPVGAAPTVNWSAPVVPLKPGRNEILVTATDSAGAVGTARLWVTRAADGPVVSNVTLSRTSVPVYETVEVRFDLATVADTPFFSYDAAPPPGVAPGTGVSVEGLFTGPSGRVYRQPGFLLGEVTQTAEGSEPHFEETGRAFWTVRFSPPEQGPFTVTVRVQDASGSADARAAGFIATAPSGRGPIRVSRNDPRYFEFSSGELFVPIGPASGTDPSVYRDTGINLERPWMAGEAAYSTNFARWMRIDLPMGNEGFDNPLTFTERYPSHELSREIYYPEGRRIWMGLWNDERYYPRLRPGATYRIKLRIRTVDIAGPADPARPFGFMVKTHGFPTETIDTVLGGRPSIIPPIGQNRGWHTVVVTYTAPSDVASTPYFSLLLDNVTAGRVFIDQFSIRQQRGDGSLGGELIRHSMADLHTYVEQRPAAFFDWQLRQGAASGVFFKYVVQDKRDWVPAHLSKAGMFQAVGDGYFQQNGTKAKWLMSQWWRYLAARWGSSTAVHSWELCNEADPNDPAVYRQTQDFANFMHTVDAHRHLATTSFWCCWVPGFWGDTAKYPDVDYADIHEYTKDSRLGLDMVEWVLSLDQTTRTPPIGKPVVLGETGIGYAGQPSFEDLKRANPGVWYHNMLWAQLLSASGLSSPNYWWSEHLSQIDRRQIARPFARFVATLEVNRGGFVDAAATVSNARLRAGGQKHVARNTAFLWIQNRLHNWHNVMGVEGPEAVTAQSGSVTLRMAPSTTFTIERWNTYTGALVDSRVVQSDSAGTLTISVSNLTDDVAVKVKGPSVGVPAAPRGLRIVR